MTLNGKCQANLLANKRGRTNMTNTIRLVILVLSSLAATGAMGDTRAASEPDARTAAHSGALAGHCHRVLVSTDISCVSIVLLIQNSRSCAGKWPYNIVFPTENPRSCAGTWPHNNRLSFCSREFTTLKGMLAGIYYPEGYTNGRKTKSRGSRARNHPHAGCTWQSSSCSASCWIQRVWRLHDNKRT